MVRAYCFTLSSLIGGRDSSLVVGYYQGSILVEHIEFITCVLLLSIISCNSILLELVVVIGSTVLLVIIREEYPGRARSVYHLCLIIEYYQLK